MQNNKGFVYTCAVIAYRWISAFGINPLRLKNAFRGIFPYFRDRALFGRGCDVDGFRFDHGTIFPCLGDRYEESGTASGAYFHQDLLVAQKIFSAKPVRHLDVGSSVAGFVAHVASFREIEVLDVRPLGVSVRNIRFRQCDMMAPLDEPFVECCDSLSCLHALEHFGLGRYGDPVCADGFLLGWENLFKMLKPNGTLYFSVPLGKAQIEFNAHRIFSVVQLRQLVGERFELLSFSYVDDAGALHENQPLCDANGVENYGCHFGCAILELKKK